jgi:hypothetical protein
MLCSHNRAYEIYIQSVTEKSFFHNKIGYETNSLRKGQFCFTYNSKKSMWSLTKL